MCYNENMDCGLIYMRYFIREQCGNSLENKVFLLNFK